MSNNSLIFIPDITGFTNFVTKTAIEHSKEIISSLLEIIIKTNNDKLNISEIEGDAILFYKKDNIPDVEEMLILSKNMFFEFHKYLKESSKVNKCKCEACKEAPNLSLKFVAHVGELDEIKINNFTKIHGKGVIVAHRLLKNNLKLNEYFLLTKECLKNYSLEKINPLCPEKPIINKEIISGIGEVDIIVIPFKSLLNEI